MAEGDELSGSTFTGQVVPDPEGPQARSGPTRPAYWLISLAAGIATILVHGYRLSAGPDVFGDEGAYLLVGLHLADGAGLTLGHGLFLWHPPLYMLIEAALIRLGGFGGDTPISVLFDVRWINVVLSAATAGLLGVFAYRLRGLGMAAIIGILFIFDPYIQRINRRSMLETATIFFVVAALYLFSIGEAKRSWNWRGRTVIFSIGEAKRSWSRWLGPGIAFGLAILTKESAAVFLLVPIAYSFLGKPERLGDALRAVVSAAIVYLSYVVTLVLAGDFALFWSYKWYELQRVLHVLVGWKLGAPPSGGTLQTANKALSEANLRILLQQYASSYLLIGVAMVGTIILLTRFKRDRHARLLAVWFAIAVASGVVFIKVSDQFVYYVIVPAVLVDAYLLDAAIASRRRAPHAAVRHRWHVTRRWATIGLSALVMATCALYGSYKWVANYVMGSDACYSRVVARVYADIPPGQTIESTNEVSNYFLAGRYDVRMDRAPSVLIARDVHFFILSSKDLWSGNQATTPAFYDWVRQHSRPLLVCHDTSYWNLGLYYRGGSIAGSMEAPVEDA